MRVCLYVEHAYHCGLIAGFGLSIDGHFQAPFSSMCWSNPLLWCLKRNTFDSQYAGKQWPWRPGVFVMIEFILTLNIRAPYRLVTEGKHVATKGQD